MTAQEFDGFIVTTALERFDTRHEAVGRAAILNRVFDCDDFGVIPATEQHDEVIELLEELDEMRDLRMEAQSD